MENQNNQNTEQPSTSGTSSILGDDSINTPQPPILNNGKLNTTVLKKHIAIFKRCATILSRMSPDFDILNEFVQTLTSQKNNLQRQLEVSQSGANLQFEILTAENRTLRQQIIELNESIENLRYTIASQKTMISNLQSESEKRKEQIKTLKIDIERKIELISTLTDLNSQIELENRIKGEVIKNLNNDIDEKNEVIKNLNNDIDEKNEVITNLNNDIDEKNEVITNLNNDIDEKNEVITNLNKDIDEKEVMILDLNKDINQESSKNKEKDEKIISLTEANEQLEAMLQELQEKNNAFENFISEKYSRSGRSERSRREREEREERDDRGKSSRNTSKNTDSRSKSSTEHHKRKIDETSESRDHSESVSKKSKPNTAFYFISYSEPTKNTNLSKDFPDQIKFIKIRTNDKTLLEKMSKIPHFFNSEQEEKPTIRCNIFVKSIREYSHIPGKNNYVDSAKKVRQANWQTAKQIWNVQSKQDFTVMEEEIGRAEMEGEIAFLSNKMDTEAYKSAKNGISKLSKTDSNKEIELKILDLKTRLYDKPVPSSVPNECLELLNLVESYMKKNVEYETVDRRSIPQIF